MECPAGPIDPLPGRTCPRTHLEAWTDCAIEPIEQIELQLGGPERNYRPICYRLRVDGHEVGWTGWPDPPPPPDRGPLPMEAVLPIPRWRRTGS